MCRCQIAEKIDIRKVSKLYSTPKNGVILTIQPTTSPDVRSNIVFPLVPTGVSLSKMLPPEGTRKRELVKNNYTSSDLRVHSGEKLEELEKLKRIIKLKIRYDTFII